MQVREVMHNDAIACKASDKLNTAAQLMWEHDCGALPVIGDDGRILSMITDRDACMAAYTQGQPLHAIPVASAMANQAAWCRADDPIDLAEAKMRDMQIRRLPVVDSEDRPIGVLSISDLARVAAYDSNGLGRGVLETLAAVSGPRRFVRV